MRISDWSSDVCSADLPRGFGCSVEDAAWESPWSSWVSSAGIIGVHVSALPRAAPWCLFKPLYRGKGEKTRLPYGYKDQGTRYTIGVTGFSKRVIGALGLSARSHHIARHVE